MTTNRFEAHDATLRFANCRGCQATRMAFKHSNNNNTKVGGNISTSLGIINEFYRVNRRRFKLSQHLIGPVANILAADLVWNSAVRVTKGINSSDKEASSGICKRGRRTSNLSAQIFDRRQAGFEFVFVVFCTWDR